MAQDLHHKALRWTQFSPTQWTHLLCQHKALINCAPWTDLTPAQQAQIVLTHNLHDEYTIDWAKSGGSNIVEFMLRSPSTDLDLKRLLCDDDWVRLIKGRPELIQRCAVSELGADAIVRILMDNIELFTKFHSSMWDRLPGHLWRKLLIAHPHMRDLCDGMKLSGDDVMAILINHPDLIHDVDYTIMTTHNWATVLAKQPHLEAICPCINQFNSADWYTFLMGTYIEVEGDQDD